MERAGWSQGPCAEAQRRWGICMSRGTGEAAGSREGLWDAGTRRAGVERRRSSGEEGAVQQLSREFGRLVRVTRGFETPILDPVRKPLIGSRSEAAGM